MDSFSGLFRSQKEQGLLIQRGEIITSIVAPTYGAPPYHIFIPCFLASNAWETVAVDQYRSHQLRSNPLP